MKTSVFMRVNLNSALRMSESTSPLPLDSLSYRVVGLVWYGWYESHLGAPTHSLHYHHPHHHPHPIPSRQGMHMGGYQAELLNI